jgi:hypothetical protein
MPLGKGDPVNFQGPSKPMAGPKKMSPDEFERAKATAPSFSLSGRGKYFNPSNVNGQQFNKPAVSQAIGKGLDMYMTARYFRHAGMAQAVRHTLGLQPVPSHMNDWIRAQHKFTEVGLPGLNPQDAHAHENPAEHW